MLTISNFQIEDMITVITEDQTTLQVGDIFTFDDNEFTVTRGDGYRGWVLSNDSLTLTTTDQSNGWYEILTIKETK